MDALIAIVLLAPPFFFMYGRSAWGDSSIYLTFFKNFFVLPFSYQPETISFGASSPLHVAIFAPVYLVFGEHWLPACMTLNYLLIVIGMVVLNRAIDGDRKSFLLVTLFTLGCTNLLLDTSRLYEAGSAFAGVACVYYFLRKAKHDAAVIAAGGLYLLRPELALITIAVDAYVLIGSKKRRRVLALAALSFIPSLAYHTYMFVGTGEYLPSSAFARMISLQEYHQSWLQNFTSTLMTMVRSDELTFLIGALVLAFASIERRLTQFRYELLILMPIGLLYIVLPPQGYVIHLMNPLAAVVVIAVVRYIREAMQVRLSLGAIVILLLLPTASYARAYLRPLYDYDTFLLKDLGERLNSITTAEDRLLLYEIQGQYNLNAFCYSLDGVVGGQTRNVLARRETVEHFIRANGVTYVVTFNSFNYRKAFDDTLLEKIYTHDLTAEVGDTLYSDDLVFNKIMTNDGFKNPDAHTLLDWARLNNGDENLRVYPESNARWQGHHFLWNSVYEVQ